jgi:nucleotide-binding universal stress UspA family protein
LEIDKNSPAFLEAMQDFRRARQWAVLEDVLAYLTGKSDDLLDYEEVYEKLKAGQSVERGLQQIPLKAIVGSVGRYADFTRSFLPRSPGNAERWAEVKAAITERGQIPPIAVFQIDQVYFVLDGNHRVSIARQRGDTHIPAYVTEIETDVPLEPDVQPDELIIKASYADFLARTHLHEVEPEADLSVTACGQYCVLEEQIEMYRHRRPGQKISVQQAVQQWYAEVYRPIIQIIRQRGILHRFPNRTETDLYVWIVQHQAELKSMLGWEIDPDTAANDLVVLLTAKPKHIVAWVKEKVLDAVTPDPLEAGPPPGQWRKERLSARQDCLFLDIVVPVTGTKAHGAGLDQALVVAQREAGRVHGLHVVASDADKNDEQNRQRQVEFEQHCQQANIPGELSFETGRVVRTICNQARWADLVVIHLSHLPRSQPGDRLRSGFGTLVRSCPRPILAVPGPGSPLQRALLAYDGSPKANEALFVAAYLAGKWQIPLVVVTVLEAEQITSDTLKYAQAYLETRNVTATFVQEQGTVTWAIIRTAQLYESDFIIMGGYGFNPVIEVMLGSEVDQILRAKQWPVLICR